MKLNFTLPTKHEFNVSILLKFFVPKALIINLISYNFGSNNKIVLVNLCIDSDDCVIVLINPVK